MANKKKNINDQKDLKENPFSKEGLENINKISTSRVLWFLFW